MNVIQAIILGLVEGITEFLPVSSTGHMILVSNLLGITQTDFVKSFEIIIQLGAILAVVVFYARKIVTQKELILPVLLGFVPTAIIGVIAYRFVKTYLLGNSSVVIGSLLVGGIIMIAVERWIVPSRNRRSRPFISGRDAILIGLFQALAIIPGVSRSAATIIGGLLLGVRRENIVEFSFLLAIPTMAAATGLDLMSNASLFSPSQAGLLAIGFVVSFVTALGSIRFLLHYIKMHDFAAFGVYRIVVAVIVYLVR